MMMDQYESTHLLAKELGYSSNDEGWSAVQRVLSYFEITILPTESDYNNGPAFSILIDCKAGDGHNEAHFFPSFKKWHLVRDHSKHRQLAGTCSHTKKNQMAPEAKADSNHASGISSGLERMIAKDWTKHLPCTKHVEFLKSRDWAATSLGSMQQWPPELRLMTSKILSDPRPSTLYWGPTHIAVYNEPFATIAYSRHPDMMASTAQDSLPATWPFLSQMFNKVERSGIAFSNPDFEMTVEKTKGYIEEAWYDGAFSPIKSEDGKFLGLYNSLFETTDAKLALRRSRLLHRISSSPDFHNLTTWQHIRNACQDFERDIPLLIIYSAVSEETAKSKRCTLHLESTLGIGSAQHIAPEKLEIYDGNDGLVPTLRKAKAARTPVLVDMPDGKLPDVLSEGISWRGFGIPSTHIVITPLYVTGSIAGFLIIGLNPRRPYDKTHQQFVEDIGRVSTGLLTSSISFDQAKRREEKLLEELTARDKFIRKVAEIATVGIYNMDVDGLITWANSTFYTVIGMSDSPEYAYNLSGLESVLPEDWARANGAFMECVSSKTPNTTELRLKRTWTPPGSATEEPCWILVSSTPNFENEELVGVLGCITDISHLKWAEQLQINTTKDAKEAKRQQERFVDMISHEIRNPLNAMLQCADDICTLSRDIKDVHIHDQNQASVLEMIRESSQTMLFCAAHQRRILDDVLTISKLDSSMLTIAPILVEPSIIAAQALRIFEAEMTANDIDSSYIVKQSYVDLNINCVYCDPSRLTQILINLLTNAIKFTKRSDEREVQVSVGASIEAPLDELIGLRWFPSGRAHKVISSFSTEESSEMVYLTFEVRDTGAGVSADEMSVIFDRFSQANPKTHVQYGGSGLGLFIAREMTELQGGMIGSTSVVDKGSTFAFYIESYRPRTPDTESLRITRPTSNGVEHLKTGLISNRGYSKPSISLPNDRVTVQIPQSDAANRKETLAVLLVEDNIVNQKVLSKQLLRLGCTVYIANHGAEALDVIKRTRFWRDSLGTGSDLSIILMDWEMPIMDGLTCTRQLRKFEEDGLITEHLSVIATTANVRADQVRRAYDAGVDDLLAKPFTVPALMEKIGGLVN